MYKHIIPMGNIGCSEGHNASGKLQEHDVL